MYVIARACAEQTEVYTTPAPRGTLNNGPRRASEGPPASGQAGQQGSGPTSPAQQRHSSNTIAAPRPATATSPQQTSTASPMAQTALRPSSATANTPPKPGALNIDSPVMSETLSVIDEHMNDMGTPPSSFVNGNKRSSMGSNSMYSSQPLNRASYIAGHETDEEENHLHTEEEVMAWSAGRVAEYLEDHGVEKAHCDVFKEQEITGEVLLAMEQSSLFIKEFDLGPVGRRLRTWHKIKALQDETRHSASSNLAMTRTATSEYSAGGDDHGDTDQNRSSVPRALDTSNRQSSLAGSMSAGTANSTQAAAGASAAARANPTAMSPLQTMTSITRADNPYRPSAQVIRQLQGSRRHSSIDSTSTSIDASSRSTHRKQPSFDSKWQPGQPQPNGRAAHAHTMSSESNFPKRELSFTTSSPVELDRGYFSSNEADSRPIGRNKNVLKKTPTINSASSGHSRSTSQTSFGRRNTSGAIVANSVALASSPSMRTTGLRSLTSPPPQTKPMTTSDGTNPIVTRLDGNGPSIGNSTEISASPNTPASADSSNRSKFFSSHKLKLTGMRTISDAVTKNEKSSSSPSKEDQVASPASFGSTTPSTESRSLDVEKSEAQSRTSQGSGANLVPPPATQRRPRAKTKTKKNTSAYTRGLVKLAPAEQMINCDYSGWMKKKSGSLMATWKPRLFILKGRRLSYYYADTDTEEKGLIDISFHRVLPAHNETLTGLHAAVTGAAGPPTSPHQSSTPTLSQNDLLQNPPKAGEQDEGLFIFKLVPPKTGLAKGVSFTKPTVHYFAVNSRQEGRLWMAALMKATIDRDEDGVVTTTYNQKTISLSKARARKERPPALRDESDAFASSPAELADEKAGLGIDTTASPADAVAGAERDPEKEGLRNDGDGSSIVPSIVPSTMTETEKTTMTTEGADLDDLDPSEREAIAQLAHA